jgi:hypothetical protein
LRGSRGNCGHSQKSEGKGVHVSSSKVGEISIKFIFHAKL